MKHIFLYGAPGSGKSTLGKSLAEVLDLPFQDLDAEIATQAGKDIPAIFAAEGETGFRRRELAALQEVCQGRPAVIALGGGALIASEARSTAESHGQVLFLRCDDETLATRLGLRKEAVGDQEREKNHSENQTRPLLAGNGEERLRNLLIERKEHYDSFPIWVDTSNDLKDLTWRAQMRLGLFRVRGMGTPYDVRVEDGGISRIGEYLKTAGLGGPVAVVSDSNVGPLYGEMVAAVLREAGFHAELFSIPAGEAHKTVETVMKVWDFFIRCGIDRGSTVIAVGGGVVGDLTGFAASSFLRGVAWVNVPTTLLAMADSSLGGKTGVDLPQAKNLVGAFYPPRLILADPKTLSTLPERELRGGLAEVVKHGVIGDEKLFSLCASGWRNTCKQLNTVIRQGMAVKLMVIDQDPFEKGLRQALNLGHTIGHGVELASDFQLSHGEAVGIGMVAEARLAETLGIAESGISDLIAVTLAELGLPVRTPEDISLERVLQAMRLDKKRAAGKVRFALPVRIGEVRVGVAVENWQELIFNQMMKERLEK